MNFSDGKIDNFIYSVQDKNTDEKLYFRCVVNEEYDDYFKDSSPGVWLIFEEESEVKTGG